MSLIDAILRSPVKVSVAVLLVALFGVIAMWRMPMQLTPEVEIPTINIETVWPGASPLEIETEIIQEQEEHLKGVEGVTKMSSESMDSMGRISLEFAVGSDMQKALVLVNNHLQQVPEYPIDADKPVVRAAGASETFIAWFILSQRMASDERLDAVEAKHPELKPLFTKIRATVNPALAMRRLRDAAVEHPALVELLPPELDIPTLRQFCEDTIEANFERVPGVANANVVGGVDPECQVIVEPQRLAARHVTIAELRKALAGENKDTSAGDFWEGKRRYVVRTVGQFRSVQQVEDTVVAIHDGSPIYVRDVATVRLGHKKADGFVRRYGQRCIALNVQRETGANVLNVMHGLRAATDKLNDGVLQQRGLLLTQVYDETEYIYSAVGLVSENIIVGGALTMVVLMLFLHLGVRTLVVVPLIMGSAIFANMVSPWLFIVTVAIILGVGFWFARGALVVGLAIPTSIVGTFLILQLLGRSLNVISLAGLAFAVGMLVDNAIVVLEDIYRRYDLGESPFVAAKNATQEVWGAVAASTLTTLAVFLPVLFVQEEAGQLFRDIALAISAAVGLSMLVSITVVPCAAARLLKDRGEPGDGDIGRDGAHDKVAHTSVMVAKTARPEGASERLIAWVDNWSGQFVRAVVNINQWTQQSIGRRLAVVVGMTAASFVVSFLLFPRPEYLPTGNRNLVLGILLPPPGYSLDELNRMGDVVEKEFEEYWNVDPGSPQAKSLKYPVIADFFFVARGRQVFLGLRSAEPTRCAEFVNLVQEKLGQRFPGTIAVAFQTSLFGRGLSAGRVIDVEITGPHLERLVQIGGRVMGEVMKPETTISGSQPRPVPSLDLSSPEMQITPQGFQAAEMGMSAVDLGYAVNALVDGAYATDFFLGGDKIDLSIIGAVNHVQSTQDLESLPIAVPAGRLVPLASLAKTRLASGPEQVNHRERQRAITIQISPPPTVPLGEAIDYVTANIVNPIVNAPNFDHQYALTLSGSADKLQQTWEALRWNLVLALLITYLLMAALFESWLHPFVIIFSVPLGAVGGILGLRMLNVYLLALGQLPQQLDVLTMLGFIILIGTVVNNAILIVHQSLNHMKEDGLEPVPAILESVRTRIRPIFMTTITTTFGLAPLVLFPGAGSELYRGLGAVMLGGLAVSTVFTLVMIPALFSLTLDVKQYVASLWHSGQGST